MYGYSYQELSHRMMSSMEGKQFYRWFGISRRLLCRVKSGDLIIITYARTKFEDRMNN